MDRIPDTTTGKRSSRGVVKFTKYLESDPRHQDQGWGIHRSWQRVPVKLRRIHEENDRALFWRDDGKEFPAVDVAEIDRNVNDQNLAQLENGCLIHCPVSLLRHMSRAGEFHIGAHMTRITVQDHCSHHVRYTTTDTTGGSSGGAAFVYPTDLLKRIHREFIGEDDPPGGVRVDGQGGDHPPRTRERKMRRCLSTTSTKATAQKPRNRGRKPTVRPSSVDAQGVLQTLVLLSEVSLLRVTRD